MKKFLVLTLSLLLIGLYACKEPAVEPQGTNQGNGNQNPNPPPINDPDWSVPLNEVLDGGPGKDGIPSVDMPEFTDRRGGNAFLRDDELVVGIKIGSETKAYPHQILDWHEIVNDSLGGNYYSLTYCPLTGTASAWNRRINGAITSFGVSGLLYNSNLIPYDRSTNSEWSQLLLKSIHGPNKDKEIDIFQVVETTWGTWKQMYPSTQVMTTNTGFDRVYGLYPYGEYRTNNTLIFPVNNENDNFHPKERLLGIFSGEFAKAYSFTAVNHATIELRPDSFAGTDYVIVGSMSMNFLLAFETKLLDGTELKLSAVQDELPIIMKDTEGNKWDVFGEAISGPKKGMKLLRPKQMIGYWFALAAFYPDPDVFR